MSGEYEHCVFTINFKNFGGKEHTTKQQEEEFLICELRQKPSARRAGEARQRLDQSAKLRPSASFHRSSATNASCEH
ncbi:hypothetical protein RRG08_040928 [Elysia crispata]|uniref:Uncharacterized protein n=1 Tax=Elysia crispata TaxID=231223 RepID=A0AAE0XRV0_9GAST|nr:hypothetical protein RRG08_040928 [Elysia crispata]